MLSPDLTILRGYVLGKFTFWAKTGLKSKLNTFSRIEGAPRISIIRYQGILSKGKQTISTFFYRFFQDTREEKIGQAPQLVIQFFHRHL